MRQWIVAMIIAATCNAVAMEAAIAPTATIASADLEAHLYLPEVKTGFYQGTRFEWAGIVSSLTYKGHDYFGPWFNRVDPTVHDFIYDGDEIVAGTSSATMGPVQEFGVIGYDNAKPGGVFLKIGIGLLRRPDDKPYDNYRTYEIANPGAWTIKHNKDSIAFTQKLEDPSGYGYLYTKTLRLIAGKPRMVIEHRIKNTGKLPLETTVYDHNFLVMNHKGPQKDTTLRLPFTLSGTRSIPAELATIGDKTITYNKTLEAKETVYTPIEGFTSNPSDYSLHVDSPMTGTGVSITGDKPIVRMALWSIRAVLSIEPFLGISLQPQQDTTWNLTYDFYEIPVAAKP